MAFAAAKEEEEEPAAAAEVLDDESFDCRLPLAPPALNHKDLSGLLNGVTAGEAAENSIGWPCGLEGVFRDRAPLPLLRAAAVAGGSGGGGACEAADEGKKSFGAGPAPAPAPLAWPPLAPWNSAIKVLLEDPGRSSTEASVETAAAEEEAAAGLTGAETRVGGGGGGGGAGGAAVGAEAAAGTAPEPEPETGARRGGEGL